MENPEQLYDLLRIAMDKSDRLLFAIEAAQKRVQNGAETEAPMGINDLATAVHQNAKDHGWYENPRSFPEVIALMHSELSEALEEHRDGKPMVYCDHLHHENCTCDCESCDERRKPEGIAIELADCIIRILDTCAYMGIDIEAAIMLKHEYNKTRPYRHGGKAC